MLLALAVTNSAQIYLQLACMFLALAVTNSGQIYLQLASLAVLLFGLGFFVFRPASDWYWNHSLSMVCGLTL